MDMLILALWRELGWCDRPISGVSVVGVEQRFAVVAAEQEDESVEVGTEFVCPVGGVADNVGECGVELLVVEGKDLDEELQKVGELGGVDAVQPGVRHGVSSLEWSVTDAGRAGPLVAAGGVAFVGSSGFDGDRFGAMRG